MQAFSMDPLELLLARLARVIRNRRTNAGYTQAEFAHAAKVFRTFMGQIERGTANPSVKTLFRIAQVLGLSVTELFVLAAGIEGDTDPQSGPSRRTRGK
jgi:transcriptional regulator with XRE-family HTH domain